MRILGRNVEQKNFLLCQKNEVDLRSSLLVSLGWNKYLKSYEKGSFAKNLVQHAFENRNAEIVDKVEIENLSKEVSYYAGKVRDCFGVSKFMVLAASDRISSFDRVLTSIPFKGEILTEISKFWFEKTRHIMKNHIVSIPHSNVVVGRQCNVFPVEFVVRGYLTGSTGTSIWTAYDKHFNKENKKEPLVYCGHEIPGNLKKNDKLPTVICTPTTKSDVHDELTTREEIIKSGLMTEEDYDFCEKKAIALFNFGSDLMNKRGLVLVDTKYEFGRILEESSEITLCDEIHTPDSSRFWKLETLKSRLEAGKEPESFDKEFFRLWYKERCDPYKDDILPSPPVDFLTQVFERYSLLYEMITKSKFLPKLYHSERQTRVESIKKVIKEELKRLMT